MTAADATADDSERQFQELLVQAKAGDQVAVDQVIREIQRYLLKIANDRTPQWFPASQAPSDYVQETLMILTRKIPAFEGPLMGWHAYARVILINKIRESLPNFVTTGNAPAPETPDPRSGPVTSLLKKEVREMFQIIRRQMKPEYQMVLELRDQKLKFHDVGRQMQRTEDAARRLWERAWLDFTDRVQALGLLDQMGATPAPPVSMKN